MISAIVAALLPLVPSIIREVEGLFKGKEKSGEEKMSTAVAMLLEASKKAQANKIINEIPTDETLRAMIETVFQGVQKDGKLVAPSDSIYVLRGTVSKCNLL